VCISLQTGDQNQEISLNFAHTSLSDEAILQGETTHPGQRRQGLPRLTGSHKKW
jgi:hypothetical protein